MEMMKTIFVPSPSKRATLETLRACDWAKGEIPSAEEVQVELEPIIAAIESLQQIK